MKTSSIKLVFPLIILMSLVGCENEEQTKRIINLEKSVKDRDIELSSLRTEIEIHKNALNEANLRVASLTATLKEKDAAEKRAKEESLAKKKKEEKERIAEEKKLRDAQITAENKKRKQEEKLLDDWNSIVEMVRQKKLPDGTDVGTLMDGTSARMTNNGRGIFFKDKQFEMLGLIGFKAFEEKLGIPDYILEDISSTRPINGRQEKQYENVIINWSVDRESAGGSLKYLEISVSLRIAD